ncbi:LysR family transcriptional regulator [Aquibium carbonis]|uniref:LysR family transcriptional regulator n=1 Tax=Aquibium carbonis TaxID=2495581 RepID=A0A3S0AVC9_9HYPH|nr:LysR family transcriptional regulator [Aquibium carbonis]RST88005.1 LysR family transcriptional regulator [Aquibium carbonis]
MQLDSDLLRTFVAVAETGNFTKAGEQVGRTQSAVSMQVKRLEETLGDILFERGSRGVVLTRKGDLLLPNARRIVALMHETMAAFRAPPLSGHVRIGIPEEYGQSILSRALGAFSKRHPDVDLTVNYGCSAVHLAKVQGRELDLAVIFEWQDFSEGEILMTDPTVWVTSTMHRMHEETPVPIALYGSTGWCREFALRSLEQRGVEYRIAYSSDTSGGLKLAVLSGLAIAPISRSNIPEGCRELGAGDGFGVIDASHVVLHRHPRSTGGAVSGMADAIREAFGTSLATSLVA